MNNQKKLWICEKRLCNPSPEVQVILLKDISLLWDKVETYERYAEEERIQRIRTVNAFRKHEERMFGKVKDIRPDVREDVKEDSSPDREETNPKKQRIMMMRTRDQNQPEVDRRVIELIRSGDAKTLEFDVSQEESRIQQRIFNQRRGELTRLFQVSEASRYRDF